MIDWIKSLFGKGYARVHVLDMVGNISIVRFHYVGEYDEAEMLPQFRDAYRQQTGVDVRSTKVLEVVDTRGR